MTIEIRKASHYNQVPGIEAIDVCKHFNFNVGNALKYLWRHDAKGNPIADLRKARQYIDYEIARLGANEAIDEAEAIIRSDLEARFRGDAEPEPVPSWSRHAPVRVPDGPGDGPGVSPGESADTAWGKLPVCSEACETGREAHPCEAMTARKVAEFLQDAFEDDPRAINSLFSFWTTCNQTLADHPSIPVGLEWIGEDGPKSRSACVVRFIGILNGMISGPELVAIVRDDEAGDVKGFKVVNRKDATS